MRPFFHKAFSLSRLSVNYLLRKLFWVVFLLCLGFAIGTWTGLYKQIDQLNRDDVTAAFILGATLILSFILWLIFMIAHRKRRRKEEMHSFIEYLEGLRDRGALSTEDYLKEKEKIIM
jgi:Na+/proline symporter